MKRTIKIVILIIIFIIVSIPLLAFYFGRKMAEDVYESLNETVE